MSKEIVVLVLTNGDARVYVGKTMYITIYILLIAK